MAAILSFLGVNASHDWAPTRAASAGDFLERQIRGARAEQADRRHHHPHRGGDEHEDAEGGGTPNTPAMMNDVKMAENRLHE